MRQAVPGWQFTESLDALQEFAEVAETLPVGVARRAGLSVTELHTLRHLMRGPLGPVEIARILGVTTAASSGVVDRMCRHGHARRQPHPQDGRRTVVVITDSGRAEVLAYLRPMFAALSTLDSGLTAAEREVVARYLRGATDAMRAVLD